MDAFYTYLPSFIVKKVPSNYVSTLTIKRNKDEKLASLDIVSKDRLKMHESQFKNKNSISMQSVIDKKKHFEETIVLNGHNAGNKSADLEYFKNVIPNKNLSLIEKNKELERY